MKTINDFKFKDPAFKRWTSPNDISNEAFTDWAKDKIAASLTSKDIQSAKGALAATKTVAKASLGENRHFAAVDSSKTILSFYTKNGRIIDSFEEALSEEAKEVALLSEAIMKLTHLVQTLEPDTDEVQALGVLNDASLLPIFHRVSHLSFLGSIYIQSVKNDHIEHLKVREKVEAGKVQTTKQIYALHWVKNLLIGAVRSVATPITHFGDFRRALSEGDTIDKLFSLTGVFLSSSASEVKSQLEKTASVRDFNESIVENIEEILNAASIDTQVFSQLTRDLAATDEKLLQATEAFLTIDTQYKQSSNSLIRLTLRNTRALCALGLRVVSRHGAYYKAIFKG